MDRTTLIARLTHMRDRDIIHLDSGCKIRFDEDSFRPGYGLIYHGHILVRTSSPEDMADEVLRVL